MRLRYLIFRITFLISIFFLPTRALCQKKDFGIWYGIKAEHSVNKKLNINALTNIRTYHNASDIEEAFIEGEVAYDFNKYFSAATSYRLTENREDNSEYHIRHKWFADVKGTLPLNDFSFSARIMYQIQTKTYIEDEEDKIPDSHYRIRIKGKYNIPKFPVNPYLSYEVFAPLFDDSDLVFDKKRFIAGFELKIIKKHSIEAEYLFERDYVPRLSDINIVSFTYIIKF